MCLSAPKAPDVPLPQPVKEPDSAALRDRMRKASGPNGPRIAGSLLTGPQGAAPAATGKATLLGG